MSTNSKPNWVKGTVLKPLLPGMGHIVFDRFRESDDYAFFCSGGRIRVIEEWVEDCVTSTATSPKPQKSVHDIYREAMLYGNSSMKISYDHLDKVSVDRSVTHSCSNHLQHYTGFLESYQFCSLCDKKFRT